MLVRRHPVATISALSHSAGLAALAIAAAIAGVDGTAFAIGLAAGTFGAVSLYTFYKAMSIGTMSIVSPLLALGSVLAFGLAVAGGERPSALALLGALVALSGAVLASLGWALAAPLALGFYLYLLARGADAGGSISAVFGARSMSALLLVVLALALRSPLRLEAAPLASASLIGVTAAGA